MLRVPPPVMQAAQNGRSDAIEVHMVAYYYAALTNLFCQVCFPNIDQLEHNDVVGALLDVSCGDFHMLDSWLGAIEPNEIWASANSHMYLEVRDVWRQQVKDWTTISKNR